MTPIQILREYYQVPETITDYQLVMMVIRDLAKLEAMRSVS